jgi:hypothetical protein
MWTIVFSKYPHREKYGVVQREPLEGKRGWGGKVETFRPLRGGKFNELWHGVDVRL